MGTGRKDGWTAAVKQEKKGKRYIEKGERKGVELCGREWNEGTIIRKSHYQKLQMLKKEALRRKPQSLSGSPRKWKRWKLSSKDILEIVNQGYLASKQITLTHIAPLWLIHVHPAELVWEGKCFLRPSEALKWISISDKRTQSHFQNSGIDLLNSSPSLWYDGLPAM